MQSQSDLHIVEIPFADPVAALSRFAQRSGTILLHSALAAGRLGRYSFLAVDPFQTLTSKDGRVELPGRVETANPFEVLRAELRRFPLSAPATFQPVGHSAWAEPPPFLGGAAGCFSFDLAHHFERLPRGQPDDLDIPDLMLGFYDVIAAYDHYERRAAVIASGWPETDPPRRRQRARERATWLASSISQAPPIGDMASRAVTRPMIASNFERATYQAAVQRVIDYIYAGDVFQVNLAQRFQATIPPDFSRFDLYRRLVALNAAPFAGFQTFGDFGVVSSSPERFLQLRRGRVEARPIKGTRPRSPEPAQDRALADELMASEKDGAEHVMIVDLLRNDLSRVCKDGTVTVPEFRTLEGYATVWHLVSSIHGQLRPGMDAIDLLAATFPGGSITGAPKVRALEIISELEPTRRGPYCGSMGYLGFDGAMDTNILIRTFVLRDGEVTFQAGGGIVADSVPEAEYEETLAKADALVRALRGGL